MQIAQALPDKEIYLRNNSRSQLQLYFYTAGGSWQPFLLKEASEVVFKGEQAWIAIGTDEVTSASWPIDKFDPSRANADRLRWHGYVVRLLNPSTPSTREFQRYEVCWSTSLSIWVIRELRDPSCASLDPGKTVV